MDNPLVICLIIVVAFPVFFGLMLCIVCGIISLVSGWNKLAKHYKAEAPAELKWLPCNVGRVGIMDYSEFMRMNISEEGLYLKTWPEPFFKFMHPPLLIPWNDVKELEPRKILAFDYVRIVASGVSVWLPQKYIEQIKERVG